MMHHMRPHTITVVAEAATDSAIAVLAEKLTQHAWTLCTGFRLGRFLFLNDATSENGAQEYAILCATPNPNGSHDQIESVTASWMSEEEMRAFLARLYEPDARPMAYTTVKNLWPHPSGACARCA